MATMDESVRPVEYNYRTKEELVARGKSRYLQGELTGFSVFKLDEEKIYHTYSTYDRGCERVNSTYALLDITPLGRQDSLYGRHFKRNYEYDEE